MASTPGSLHACFPRLTFLEAQQRNVTLLNRRRRMWLCVGKPGERWSLRSVHSVAEELLCVLLKHFFTCTSEGFHALLISQEVTRGPSP